jgi:hypothetical protein
MSKSLTMAGIAAVLFAAAAQAADNLPPVIINNTMAPLPSAPGLTIAPDQCDDPGLWEQTLNGQGQKSVMKIDGQKKIHEIFANAKTGDWTILETEKNQPEEGFACKVNEGKDFKSIKPFLDMNID